MHAERASLWHVVMHDSEDTFFHLTSVRCSQDCQLLFREVDTYARGCVDILSVCVGDKLSSIQDREVNAFLEVLLNLGEVTTDEHLLHEESMVRPGRDHTSLDSVIFVPAGIPINNENPFAHVEEVGSSLLVAGVPLRIDGDVDVTPVDGVTSHVVEDDSLFLWHTASLVS